MVGIDLHHERESSAAGKEARSTFPTHYNSVQDTAESAKRWHLAHVVAGLGQEIGEAEYKTLASKYAAAFEAARAAKKT